VSNTDQAVADQGGNGVPAADQPAETPSEKTYSESEVKQRLRGQAKELERLQAAATELERLKAEQAERNKKSAEERGEYERLYNEQAGEFERIKRERDELRGTHDALNELLSTEVKSQVDAIEDKGFRKRIEGLLADRPVLDQRAILSTVLAARGNVVADDATPPAPRATPPKGNAPGQATPGTIDEQRFAADSRYRKRILADAYRREKG
jgi:hypothetical protein